MSNLSLREIAQSQLDSTPVIDGQLIVCLDTGNAYRDTATAHVKIGSDLEVVSDLPLAPLAEKIYYLKPDKLYVFLGGNWTLLNDKTIDLDEAIAKLPAGDSTSLNDDVEIITQDTDITQSHYYRRKLVVLWEYIKTKAQDFFAAKNHKHGKADITDFPTSMPASDVYPWAKAATKPSYTKTEIGLGKVDNTADADKTVKRATTAGTADSANSVAWENVKNKPTTFPVEAHNHDDRYYTEAEMDGKLSGKSNTGHTHDDRYYTESEVETKLSGKADINHIHLNGTVGGDVDWNTFITYGVYKIQNCTMSDTYHAPNPEYQYGILQVLDSENNVGEKRILQIYWPHITPNGNHFWYRMHNNSDTSDGWTGWVPVKNKPDASGISDVTNALSGFTPRSSQGWGVQTGTFVHGEGDNTGGDFAFRRDCPNAGQVSMILDGRFYQNGGQYRVLDESDEKNLNVQSANFAKETYISQYKTVNLTDLDQNTWYPVTGTSVPYNGLRRFKCNVQLNSGSKPSWSTHSGGFTAVVDILYESSGWGTTCMQGMVLVNDQIWINDYNKPPVGYQQMSNGSIPVWWLRGGGTYFLAADYDCTWTIRKSTYTNSGQSVSPTTTYPGVSVNRAAITANLDGNAKTATNASHSSNSDRWAGLSWRHNHNTTDTWIPVISDNAFDYILKHEISADKLPLSGGTMSGQITKSTGGSWIGDRDRAAIKSSYAGDWAYGAVAAMATKNGCWTMGNLGGNESLIFNYSPDSNYSAGKNETSQVYLPAQAGTIITSATIGSQSVNYANSAGGVAWGNVSGKPSTFTPSSHTHSSINSLGVKNAQTGRNQIYGNVYSYNSNASAHTGMPTTYTSTIGFGQGASGTVEICGEWTGGKGLWSRALRDCCDNWYDWQRIYTDNYHPNADYATKANSADNASTSNGVKDYNDGNRTIKIGYAGSGLTADNLTHIAGYTDNGTKLKDVNKDVLKSWIGKVASATSADNGVTASGKTGAGIYYVRFGNGTQMCWGFYKESDHSGSTSFPVAFNNSQYSISLTVTVSSNNAPYITGRSTTSFSYARHGTSYNDVQWIAVGTWK